MQNCYALRVISLPNAFPRRITKLQLSSKSQEVIIIIECYENFHLYVKFLLSSAYSRVQPNRKEDTMQKKRIIISLDGKDFYILSFMTLGMDLVIMSDITGMLWCLIILSFMSLSMDLIMIHDKKGVMSCCKVVSKRVLRKKVVILKTVQQIWYYRGLSDGVS